MAGLRAIAGRVRRVTAGLYEEAAPEETERAAAFEPTRAERVRIWAACLAFGALAQLGIVAALMPADEPRYVVRLEAIERRPMFVPTRFGSSAMNRAATEGAMNRAATEGAATERGTEGAMNRAATEGAMNRAATERAATEGAMNRAATERAATERAATGLGRRSVDARIIARGGTNAAAPRDLAPETAGASTGEAGPEDGEAEDGEAEEGEAGARPPGDGPSSPAPEPQSRAAGLSPAPTPPPPSPEPSHQTWAAAVGSQLSRGLRYPRDAEEDGVEGVALVRLHVEADGRVTSVELARSSGDPRLDEAALARARALQRLPRPPHDARVIDVPVRFRLP